MKESEVWRRIARDFERAKYDKYFGDWATSYGSAGLCDAVDHYAFFSSAPHYDAMIARMGVIRRPNAGAYWYSVATEEGRDCRVIAACLLAAMAEDDEKKKTTGRSA